MSGCNATFLIYYFQIFMEHMNYIAAFSGGYYTSDHESAARVQPLGQFTVRLDRLHSAYPNLHPSGVVHRHQDSFTWRFFTTRNVDVQSGMLHDLLSKLFNCIIIPPTEIKEKLKCRRCRSLHPSSSSPAAAAVIGRCCCCCAVKSAPIAGAIFTGHSEAADADAAVSAAVAANRNITRSFSRSFTFFIIFEKNAFFNVLFSNFN